MKAYEIIMDGDFQVERVEFLPSWAESDEGRIIYETYVGNLYVGTDTGWEKVTGLNRFKPVRITDNYSLQPFEMGLVNSTSKSFTITLPSSADASFGDQFALIDTAMSFSSNNIEIERNGCKIMGKEENLIADVTNAHIYVFYDNGNYLIGFAPFIRFTGESDIGSFIGDTGVFGGGYYFGDGCYSSDVIDYVSISTAQNAIEFGDLLESASGLGATSNGSGGRGLFFGSGENGNKITYVTIATPSNALEFGEGIAERSGNRSAISNGSNNRGLLTGGYSLLSHTIEYLNISIQSNANVFGNLGFSTNKMGATSNGKNERGIFGGGAWDDNVSEIEYVTISTESNAYDFGSLLEARMTTATSNDTDNRGVFIGGITDEFVRTKTIEYVIITSLADSQDQGDLLTAKATSATSNGVKNRGLCVGGSIGEDIGTDIEEFEYFTLYQTPVSSSLGGDLTISRRDIGATSNSAK